MFTTTAMPFGKLGHGNISWVGLGAWLRKRKKCSKWKMQKKSKYLGELGLNETSQSGLC